MMEPILLLAFPWFGFTMAVEAAWLWREKGVRAVLGQPNPFRGYTLSDSFGSLGMGIGSVAVNAVVNIGFVAILTWLYSFRWLDIQPGIWSWLALILLDDFAMYWSHRFGHEVRLMWCGHHNHHSSSHYNLSTALRQSWFENFFHPIFWGFLPLLGFPVEMILTQMALNLLYQYWLHTELIGDMGWFGWVFNTPSFHRVHHGRNPQYMDRNYGGIFIIWDRLFGTFEPEKEVVDYGVTVPVGSDNPLRIAFAEYRAWWSDMRSVQTLRGALGVTLGPPGWREDGQHKTARIARQHWEEAGKLPQS